MKEHCSVLINSQFLLEPPLCKFCYQGEDITWSTKIDKNETMQAAPTTPTIPASAPDSALSKLLE